MTKEETKRRAEIMLAAEYEGDNCTNIEYKSINFKSYGWRETSDPTWDWINYDYRVISEPRTIYIKVFENGDSVSDEYLDHLKPFGSDTTSVLKITIVDGKPTAEFIDMESVK